MKIKALALIAALAATLPGVAAAAPAPRFLQDAVAGDNGEVDIGRLAQQRATSRDAIELGRTLERDHADARQQALQTARQLRIRVDAGAMKPAARQLHRRLAALPPRAFDREFARAMVSDHRKDIAAFETQARTGDRATRQLARDTLPHLRHHLRMALKLQRTL